MEFLIIFCWIIWPVWSYYIAKKKGYNEILAIIGGLLLGLFAIIMYAILPMTKEAKIKQIKEEEEIRKEALKENEKEVNRDNN